MRFLFSRFFRLVSQIISEFTTIDFYNLFTPTCTSSFYPDDHIGRFMGFSRFVELKSARFVERKKNEKEFIRDKRSLFICEGTFIATKGFSLSMIP